MICGFAASTSASDTPACAAILLSVSPDRTVGVVRGRVGVSVEAPACAVRLVLLDRYDGYCDSSSNREVPDRDELPLDRPLEPDLLELDRLELELDLLELDLLELDRLELDLLELDRLELDLLELELELELDRDEDELGIDKLRPA